MTTFGKGTELPYNRVVCCPHCNQDFEVTGMKPVPFRIAVVEWLRTKDQPMSVAEINEQFDGYQNGYLNKLLIQLKIRGTLISPRRGFYWVEK